MEILMIIIGFYALVSGVRIINKNQENRRLEIEKDTQLKLEAQRFEKIKEIMTDGVIEGSPKALDALKPLVEIMANQMNGPAVLEREKILHEQRMREIEALNEPYRLYVEQIQTAQENNDYSHYLIDELKALSEANERFLPKHNFESYLRPSLPDGVKMPLEAEKKTTSNEKNE